MRAFEGFSPAAVAFCQELRLDNLRGYWEANEANWEAQVLTPMQCFI